LKYECVFAVASIWNLMTNRLRRLIQEIQWGQPSLFTCQAVSIHVTEFYLKRKSYF
jgi:hypothetical protein